MTPTPVGMRCPECAPGPSRVQRAASGVSPETPIVTYILMAICIAIEFGVLSAGGDIGGGSRGNTQIFQDFALRVGGGINPFTGQEGPGGATRGRGRLGTPRLPHHGGTHPPVHNGSLYFPGSVLGPAVRR